MVAADIHGVSGLDGTDLLPEPDESCILRNEKAVLHMAQVLRDYPTKVNIVAVGPFTNVALLLTLFPEVKQKIAKISLMGGGIATGNRTPVAEFNVLVSTLLGQRRTCARRLLTEGNVYFGIGRS
jgi:inosine-uridine nucleoside N-ribohydrolase